MSQIIQRDLPEYEYVGRTYCLSLVNDDSRNVYMNGLRHRHFPLEQTSTYVDFLVDIYQTMDELIDDFRMHYEEDRNIRLLYGDVFYHRETDYTFVVPRSSIISEFGKHIKTTIEKRRRDIICRTHPYSQVFLEWKGRYPTYDEYVDILSAIRL